MHVVVEVGSVLVGCFDQLFLIIEFLVKYAGSQLTFISKSNAWSRRSKGQC